VAIGRQFARLRTGDSNPRRNQVSDPLLDVRQVNIASLTEAESCCSAPGEE
jgi:hypothetical protein